MPAPLTGSDAQLMRRLEVPLGRRLLPLAMILFGGFAAYVIVLSAEPVPVCTRIDACRPDPGSSVFDALLIGVVVLAFLQPWLAALAGVGAAVAVLWHNQVRPDLATSRTGVLVVLIAAGWSLAWAVESGRRRAGPAWRPELAAVPAPQRPLRTWRLGLLAGLALVVLGGATAAYGAHRIAHVEAQERAATIATGTVGAHLQKTLLRVVYPPGHTIEIPVVSSRLRSYDIGVPVQLLVDGEGLHQLINEPYDGSFFTTFALLLALGGVGLAAFSLDRDRPRRRLLRRPQPAAAVFIRRRPDHVLIFAGDAGPTDRPFAELPVRDDLLPVGANTAGPAFGSARLRTPEAAVLHGTPIPGRWCTVTVGSVTLAPRGPLRTAEDMLPFGTDAPASAPA